MPHIYFKRFEKSIETVTVSDRPRGTYETEPPTFTKELKAVIKRRNNMSESVENSEDRETRTSLHFYPEDEQYLHVGYFIKLDGSWRTIEDVKLGKNFRTGEVYFVYVHIGDDIIPLTDEPVWGRMLSA